MWTIFFPHKTTYSTCHLSYWKFRIRERCKLVHNFEVYQVFLIVQFSLLLFEIEYKLKSFKTEHLIKLWYRVNDDSSISTFHCLWIYCPRMKITEVFYESFVQLYKHVLSPYIVLLIKEFFLLSKHITLFRDTSEDFMRFNLLYSYLNCDKNKILSFLKKKAILKKYSLTFLLTMTIPSCDI